MKSVSTSGASSKSVMQDPSAKSKHHEKRMRDKEKKREKVLRKAQSAPMSKHADTRAKERSVGKHEIKRALRLGTLRQDSSKTFVVTHEKTTVILGAKKKKEKRHKNNEKKEKSFTVVTVYKDKGKMVSKS